MIGSLELKERQDSMAESHNNVARNLHFVVLKIVSSQEALYLNSVQF